MANRTPDQLFADNPIDPTAAQTTVPAMQSSALGAFDMQAQLAAKAAVSHASTHVSGGSDALSGCGLACSYSPTAWTPTAATIQGQFEGLNTKLLVLDIATSNQVKITANSESVVVDNDSATPSLRGDVTDTWTLGEPGTTWKAGYFSGGLVGTPSVSVGEAGAGIYRPAASQLGLAANSKAVIVDNDGATPSLRGDVTATWDLGEDGITWRRGYIATLVDPLIAAAADPVNKAVSLVLSSLTAARSITMPDADVDLTYVRAASVSQAGYAEAADVTETEAGTDAARYVTPSGLATASPRAPYTINDTGVSTYTISDAQANSDTGFNLREDFSVDQIDASADTVAYTVATAEAGSLAVVYVRSGQYANFAGSGVSISNAALNDGTATTVTVTGPRVVTLSYLTSSYVMMTGGDVA